MCDDSTPRKKASSTPILVPLRFHTVEDPLVYRRKAVTYINLGQGKEVDDQYSPWASGDVAAVAIESDMLLQALDLAEAECGRLLRRDDEARAMKLDARAG